MQFYKHTNIHEAYMNVLDNVFNNSDFICSPRGLECREIVNYAFSIENPKSESIKTFDIKRNLVIDEYTKKEFELYNSKSNLVKDFEMASKFWSKIGNPDGTINSAYGYLIWGNSSIGNKTFTDYIINLHAKKLVDNDLNYTNGIISYEDFWINKIDITNRIQFFYENKLITPWEWCKESLVLDKNTRQAVLHFAIPDHYYFGNKDQICTIYGIFFIRQDKLNFSIHMRSNDVIKGLTYDLPWFISLMEKMVDELKQYYPDLSVGEYTHLSNSMHIYMSDKKKILKMLGVEND